MSTFRRSATTHASAMSPVDARISTCFSAPSRLSGTALGACASYSGSPSHEGDTLASSLAPSICASMVSKKSSDGDLLRCTIMARSVALFPGSCSK